MADVIAEIGVFGGSGRHARLEDARTVGTARPTSTRVAAPLPGSQDACRCARALDRLHPTLP